MSATPFTFLLRVRYAECDPQGVVFNGRYVEYADVAFTEFMRALIGTYNNLLEQNLDIQVVNLNCAWKASARAEDVLRITAEVTKVGTTSITIHYGLSNYETNEEVANIEVVHVMVSADEYKKQPVPDELRELLLKGAPSVLVNHAGV